MSRRLTIAAFGTVPAGLILIACLATEADRGKALADGIRYVQVGCVAYLSDPRIPRHPEADALCPVLAGAPQTPHAAELDDAIRSEDAPSSSPPVLDASVGEPDGAVLNTTPGNDARSVGGVGAQ